MNTINAQKCAFLSMLAPLAYVSGELSDNSDLSQFFELNELSDNSLYSFPKL
jgi:hypothetical protein